VYVGDIADATLRAATQQLPTIGLLDARAFNLGTGIGTPVVRIAEVLRTVARSDVAIEYAPRRPGEQQESFVAVEKAGKLLGWRPAVPLEDGLARSYAWFSTRRAATLNPTSKPVTTA
jgi:UDP-glucose 4-epimerase